MTICVWRGQGKADPRSAGMTTFVVRPSVLEGKACWGFVDGFKLGRERGGSRFAAQP